MICTFFWMCKGEFGLVLEFGFGIGCLILLEGLFRFNLFSLFNSLSVSIGVESTDGP